MVIEQFEPSKYNQMNKTKNLPDLQDFTFKASLYPKQVFIGNYELKLKENTTLDFYYNNRNRLSIKFSIEADPKCGYSQRDLGIAITQFEQISTRKAMNQYPAAIVANPFQKAAQNIVNVFGDLKNRLEQQVPAEIKSIEYMKRQLIFTLREDPEDKTEEIFMNISSNKEGNHKTWSFDMDEMIEIFHTDIKERWNACLSEQWSRRAEKITKNRYGNNVESMSEGDWKGYMKSLSLHYKILNSGDYRYLLFKENPNLKSHIIQYTNAPKRRAESSLSETEADRNQSMDQNKNRHDVDDCKYIKACENRNKKFKMMCKHDRSVTVMVDKNWKMIDTDKHIDRTYFGKKKHKEDEEKMEIAETLNSINSDESKEKQEKEEAEEGFMLETSGSEAKMNSPKIDAEEKPLTCIGNEIVQQQTIYEKSDKNEAEHLNGVELLKNVGQIYEKQENEVNNYENDPNVFVKTFEAKLEMENQFKDWKNDQIEGKQEIIKTENFNEKQNSNVEKKIEHEVDEMKPIVVALESTNLHYSISNDVENVLNFSMTNETLATTMKAEKNQENYEGFHEFQDGPTFLPQQTQPVLLNNDMFAPFLSEHFFMLPFPSVLPTEPGPSNVPMLMQQSNTPITIVDEQTDKEEIKKPRLEEGKEASPSIAVPENYNNKPSGLEKSEREPNRIDVTPNTQLFVFPEKKMEKLGGESVVVCVKDVHTLGRCEFLNDTMIAFKFAHVLCYEIDEKLREKVHFFNTFFYSALVRDLNSSVFSGKRTKNGIVVEDLTLVNLAKDKKNMDKFELTDRERATVYQIEKSYRQLLTNAERLTKWTKKFDLFLKDYVVIPINEDFHWVLIIIVNPSGAIVEKNNEEESRTKPKTYIVFFDPLRGLDPSKKNHMCFCVREYLMKLFAKTKQVGATFGTKTESYYDESRISFVIPKNLPIQKNFSDCGLYVLHYIEGFFCGFKPITVDNFPNFDWADFYEEGHAMADLMRDKMYRLVTSKCDRMARSRLAKHEEMIKHGLGLETNKRTRRHSAGAWPRTSKRNSAYFFRHLSLNPPARNVSEDPFFSNPRELYVNPTAIKIRKLALPCERFPALY